MNPTPESKTQAVLPEFAGATLMITGGTGSFGNTLVDRFIDTEIARIVVFSRDEKKQEDMRIRYGNPKLQFHVGDVRDLQSLRMALRGVNFVFHAAALKQVPSCEFFPSEAVKTNVNGTENLIQAAVEAGASRVVLLSTDKAVYPINAMGITKALAEKILIAKSRTLAPTDPVLCATRYGNVMGSRGSVIPLFIEQIKHGRPLTITDPTMTRFLMSLQQSVDLVLHAFLHGNQGDLFVQKAPACTVEVLARALIELFESDSPVRIIGTRHGEKKFESLISREEMAKAEDMGAFVRIPSDSRDLNYAVGDGSRLLDLDALDDYTSHNTTQLDVEQVKELLLMVDVVREELCLTPRPAV
jgi:UDP-N-acetylglucosamine 4,6-dehydratase